MEVCKFILMACLIAMIWCLLSIVIYLGKMKYDFVSDNFEWKIYARIRGIKGLKINSIGISFIFCHTNRKNKTQVSVWIEEKFWKQKMRKKARIEITLATTSILNHTYKLTWNVQSYFQQSNISNKMSWLTETGRDRE